VSWPSAGGKCLLTAGGTIPWLARHRLPAEEQAYALGAVDYLVKPIVPFVLRAKVAWFVELFQKAGRAERRAEELRYRG
jgi:DNA-binding response OmpR family regulator